MQQQNNVLAAVSYFHLQGESGIIYYSPPDNTECTKVPKKKKIRSAVGLAFCRTPIAIQLGLASIALVHGF